MLRAHLADGRVGLLQKGCEVLKIMTRDVNNKAKCGAAGGVEVLVEILRRYQVGGPALVLQEACAALGNSTCSNTDNKAKCGAAGGVEVLVEILRRYQVGGPALVLQRACGALWSSTYSNTANKAKCRAAGGVEVVRQIQQRRANDDADLAGVCAGLLGDLS